MLVDQVLVGGDWEHLMLVRGRRRIFLVVLSATLSKCVDNERYVADGARRESWKQTHWQLRPPDMRATCRRTVNSTCYLQRYLLRRPKAARTIRACGDAR